jgi:hypothetical protein
MDRGREMLNVIRDIYDGGKDLIRNWQLLAHATERLQRDGVEGLKRYYEEYVDLPRGRRVNEILAGHRRKTLKSERRLFMTIYKSTSHVVDAGHRAVSGRGYTQLNYPTIDPP